MYSARKPWARDFAALWKTGSFSDIELKTELGAHGGLMVRFVLTDRKDQRPSTVIDAIEIRGAIAKATRKRPVLPDGCERCKGEPFVPEPCFTGGASEVKTANGNDTSLGAV